MESTFQSPRQLLALVVSVNLISTTVPPRTIGPSSPDRSLLETQSTVTYQALKTTEGIVRVPSAMKRLGPDMALDNPRSLVSRGEKKPVAMGEFNRKDSTPGALDATFIENKGQWDERVRFQFRSGGKTLWLTNNAIVFDNLRSKAEGPTSANGSAAVSGGAHREPEQFDRLVFYEDFRAAAGNPKVEPIDPRPGAFNYLTGSDSGKWHTGVKGYGGVIYHNIWEGVDFKISGKGPNLEQEFIVRPGFDSSRVQVTFRGIKELEIAKDGSLLIHTAYGDLRESTPQNYQEIAGRRVPIAGQFRLTNDAAYTFKTDSTNPAYPLVIDPTLAYSTYLGGTGGSIVTAVAVDSSGSAYVTGSTAPHFCGQSDNFPTTPGAFQITSGGTSSCSATAFVSKFNPAGDALVYSTYLGGSGSDFGTGIAVDTVGNAFVVGFTGSANFPTTPGVFQSSLRAIGGGCFNCGNVFVAKLNSTGSGLLYSTYLGGTGGASASGIAIDSSGDAYVTGVAWSGDFPTTKSALRTAANVLPTAFVTEMNPSGTGLIYSTFLGGAGTFGSVTHTSSIAVDNQGNVYVTGATDEADFPTTQGAYKTVTCGSPAFVTKINPSGSQLVYSTLIGGTTDTGGIRFCSDSGTSIVVDTSGNAYVAGYTGDNDFPTTPGVFQGVRPPGAGPWSAFLAKLNPFGSGLIYSTYLGGNGQEYAYVCGDQPIPNVAIDNSGDAYVSGCTTSTNFPVTADAVQSIHLGISHNAFLTVLNPNANVLLYSTYLGGSGDGTGASNDGDAALGLAVDAFGNAYVAGQTYSPDFPTTPGAFQTGRPTAVRFDSTGFVTKFAFGSIGPLLPSVFPEFLGNTGTASISIFLPNGIVQSCIPSVKLSLPGQASLTATVVSVTDANHIQATFDLAGVTPGVGSVVVTNCDGSSVTIPQSVDVIPGGAPEIWIDVLGWSKLRGGEAEQYFVVYGNQGNVDAQQPFTVWVTFPNFMSWSLPPGITPTVSTTAAQNIALSFDVFDTIPVGGTRVIPITLTVPDDPKYAHLNIQINAWVPQQ